MSSKLRTFDESFVANVMSAAVPTAAVALAESSQPPAAALPLVVPAKPEFMVRAERKADLWILMIVPAVPSLLVCMLIVWAAPLNTAVAPVFVVVACYLKVKNSWERVVLDTSLKDGHALGTGDFLGLGYDQVVAGWRAMRPSGKPGLKLFVPADKSFRKWKEFQLSSKEIAVEDLKIADLDGDGKPEIVASGRQTHNLVVFWNQSGNP